MISVIVPVYKAEKFLHRCVDSILAQSYKNLELLLIDDGSPDNSGVICDEYATKDSRVRVFHIENGGVSSARNLGLDNAKGDWVTFVDSDDWLELGCLKEFMSHLDADYIVCSVKSSTNGLWGMKDCICSPEEFVSKYIFSPMVRAPWGALLKLEIINKNKIRFDPFIRYGEDMIFNMQYFLFVSSVHLMSYIGYNYFQSEEVSHAQKYNLTTEEIRYALNKTLTIKKELNDKKNSNLSYDVDYIIYLSLFPVERMSENQFLNEYYSLCLSFDSELSWDLFFNHKIFSPTIRGIAQMKVYYQNKSYERWEILCRTLHLILLDNDYKLKYPYKDFYLWSWLIKHGKFTILSFLLRIYLCSKKLWRYVFREND